MIIDLKTVVLITGMMHLIQVLIFAQQYQRKRTLSGPGWWLTWSLLELLAFTVMLFRSNPTLLPYIILIQSPLNLAGTVFVYFGVRSFLKKDLTLRFIIPLFIIYYFLHLYFSLVADNMAVRTFLLDIGIIAIAFLTAWNLLWHTKHRMFSVTRISAVILILHGLIFAVRAVAVISGTAGLDLQSKGGFNQVQYFDALLVGIVWTICFIIMMNEKLQSEILETKALLEIKISDLKKSEEKLYLKNEELEKLIAERDRFYSIVAHDLRAPFNSFLGLTQMLAERYSGMTMEEIGKIAGNLEKSAINLFGLLENLLSWSLTKQGLIQFQPRPVILAAEVEECTMLLMEQARKKSLAITAKIDDQILVFADPGILKTVLRNILSNAIKFSLPGGKIMVTGTMRADGWVEICVLDTGIGMPVEVSEKLFLDKSLLPRKGTAGESGTGLGLMLCSEFIEMHKGQIRIESAPEKGTAFYILLPPGEEESKLQEKQG